MSNIDKIVSDLDQAIAEDDARIDIAEPLAEIARRLNVPYNDIAQITLRPGDITVVVYKRNNTGNLYIDEREQKPVTATLDFKVRT